MYSRAKAAQLIAASFTPEQTRAIEALLQSGVDAADLINRARNALGAAPPLCSHMRVGDSVPDDVFESALRGTQFVLMDARLAHWSSVEYAMMLRRTLGLSVTEAMRIGRQIAQPEADARTGARLLLPSALELLPQYSGGGVTTHDLAEQVVLSLMLGAADELSAYRNARSTPASDSPYEWSLLGEALGNVMRREAFMTVQATEEAAFQVSQRLGAPGAHRDDAMAIMGDPALLPNAPALPQLPAPPASSLPSLPSGAQVGDFLREWGPTILTIVRLLGGLMGTAPTDQQPPALPPAESGDVDEYGAPRRRRRRRRGQQIQPIAPNAIAPTAYVIPNIQLPDQAQATAQLLTTQMLDRAMMLSGLGDESMSEAGDWRSFWRRVGRGLSRSFSNPKVRNVISGVAGAAGRIVGIPSSVTSGLTNAAMSLASGDTRGAGQALLGEAARSVARTPDGSGFDSNALQGFIGNAANALLTTNR